MIKRILISLSLLYSGHILFAQSIEEVHTTKGDVYIGFISEQVPGDYITVFAEQVEITLPNNKISDLRNEYRPFYTLTESGKTWFRLHSDTTKVELASFRYEGNYIDDAKILSLDGDRFSFISFTHKTYRIPWDELRKITKKSPQDPYGVRDIVTMKTGDQLIGTVIEQVIGDCLVVQNEKGKKESVPVEEVISIKSEKISPDASIWNQAPFLDRVFFENGDFVEGFMTSKVMGLRIKLLDSNSKIEKEIPLEQIVKYQKFWNPYYSSYHPPVEEVKESQVLLDGHKVNPTHLFSDGKLHFANALRPRIIVGESFTIVVQNMDCDEKVQFFLAEYKKYGNKDDLSRYGKVMPAIKINAEPVKEYDFSSIGEGTKQCKCTLDKEGVYIVSIHGFNTVLVLDVINI